MAWTVEISDIAERQLRKLDRPVQGRILNWLNDRIEGCKNPRHFGDPLKGDHAGRFTGEFTLPNQGKIETSPIHKNFLPMQTGDVPATYVDLDDLIRDVGFKPEINIYGIYLKQVNK